MEKSTRRLKCFRPLVALLLLSAEVCRAQPPAGEEGADLPLAQRPASAKKAEKKPSPGDKPLHKFLPIDDKSGVSLAYVWLDIAEEATARDVDLFQARPTIVSRTLAVWATAMFDAWAAYDEKAVGSRLGGKLRRPKAEHTLANKKKAISYASYQSLLFVYPESKEWLAGEMKKLGYDPALVSTDPTTPEGIGHLAARAVIEYRKNDGANQLGNEVGGDGTPYGDYTFYEPMNPPDKILDPDRWQPITFTMPDGKKVTPGFLTPHWYRVKPFAMERSDQFRPAPPPRRRPTTGRSARRPRRCWPTTRSLPRNKRQSWSSCATARAPPARAATGCGSPRTFRGATSIRSTRT